VSQWWFSHGAGEYIPSRRAPPPCSALTNEVWWSYGRPRQTKFFFLFRANHSLMAMTSIRWSRNLRFCAKTENSRVRSESVNVRQGRTLASVNAHLHVPFFFSAGSFLAFDSTSPVPPSHRRGCPIRHHNFINTQSCVSRHSM
jgi:hypothetical protein